MWMATKEPVGEGRRPEDKEWFFARGESEGEREGVYSAEFAMLIRERVWLHPGMLRTASPMKGPLCVDKLLMDYGRLKRLLLPHCSLATDVPSKLRTLQYVS